MTHPPHLTLAVVALATASIAHAQTDPMRDPSAPTSQTGTAAAAPTPEPRPMASTTMPAGSRLSDSEGYSMLPYTTRGYVGVNLGQTRFDTACGTGTYTCDRYSDLSAAVTVGGLFNDWLGVELGYLYSGHADRSGGRTRAEGVGASLVLRAAWGPMNVFAKGGGLYGQTRVSAGALSDVATGKRRSWAPTWGAGLGYDFTPHHGVVLEWSSARLRFPGASDRRAVDNTSLGYVYRF